MVDFASPPRRSVSSVTSVRRKGCLAHRFRETGRKYANVTGLLRSLRDAVRCDIRSDVVRNPTGAEDGIRLAGLGSTSEAGPFTVFSRRRQRIVWRRGLWKDTKCGLCLDLATLSKGLAPVLSRHKPQGGKREADSPGCMTATHYCVLSRAATSENRSRKIYFSVLSWHALSVELVLWLPDILPLA